MTKEQEMVEITEQDSGLNRRAFLGMGLCAGLGVASAALTQPKVAHVAETAAPTGRRGILYDASKCVGCHYCESGCKNSNALSAEVTLDIKQLPESVLPKLMIPVEMMVDIQSVQPVTDDDRDAGRWLRVTTRTIDADGKVSDVYVRHSCTHCGLCARVCPAKALTQRKDGVVIVDSSRCIGCLYCYQACPFDVLRYSETEGDKTIRKCDMCAARVDEGGEPACVATCSMGALTFGDVGQTTQDGATVVTVLEGSGYSDAYLYGQKELGGIAVTSALLYPSQTYGLPELPGA
jgi:formate dehydrogenase iron-sulfur subunit